MELDSWYGQSVQEWRARWGLPELRILGVTGSTNDDVRLLAEQGAPELTVVIANQQTAGRGQHGRSWTGMPGKSLHLSALLRPATLECLPAAPVRIGLHIAQRFQGVGVKWPNDLVLEGRKLGGILCEGVAGGRSYMVVGVGINVRHQPDDFPPELAATSLALHGQIMTVGDAAGHVIDALRECVPLIGQPLTHHELAVLEKVDALRGKEVQVDGEAAGVAESIGSDGALKVSGKWIRTGTVRAQ